MKSPKDTATEHVTEMAPAILDHPQPLGFLPTRQFWRDQEIRRVVAWPLGFVAAAMVLVIVAISPTWWAAGIIGVVSMLLAQGLFERYIRRKAKQRQLRVSMKTDDG